MSKIDGFSPFAGYHCETTTTGNLLKHAGLELSEPMLLGIGEGLGFAVFVIKGSPFIGGRPKPEEITQNLATHLSVEVEYRKTRSRERAWDNVASFIDAGQPVGVKLDSYFLDYFAVKVHFAGHYVTAHGYDDTHVYVTDTAPNGRTTATSRASFEQARLWKGPMSSDALTWTVTLGDTADMAFVIRRAIVANMKTFLNPPIANLGYRGICKAARVVPTWLDDVDVHEIETVGMLMERGGTGGGLFRRFYSEFLDEAGEYVESPSLPKARDLFAQSAAMWTDAAGHLERVATEGQAGLNRAAEIMAAIASIEEEAARALVDL